MRKAYDAKRAGQPKSKYLKFYEEAVTGYERAAHSLKLGGVSLSERLRLEPRSWFQAGLAYYHLGLLYESQFCFEAVLSKYGALPAMILEDPDGKKLKNYLETIEGDARTKFEELVARIQASAKQVS